jgi:hypothetical protein
MAVMDRHIILRVSWDLICLRDWISRESQALDSQLAVEGSHSETFLSNCCNINFLGLQYSRGKQLATLEPIFQATESSICRLQI